MIRDFRPGIWAIVESQLVWVAEGVAQPASIKSVMGSRFMVADRIEVMLAAMLAQDGVRLPGARRHENRAAADCNGVELSADEAAQLADLAARPVNLR